MVVKNSKIYKLSKMKYLKLLRIKHYIKNFLIVLPLFFNGTFFDLNKLFNVFIGFITFCVVSSCVYIINDIKDVENDKNNKFKRKRPIASGEINIINAYIIFFVLLIIAFILCLYLKSIPATICLIIYVFLNVIYSFGAKHIPILDIAILAGGFIIRVIYGSIISGIEISNWHYLTIFSFSFFFSLCKRRNEFREEKIFDKRKVLRFYNFAFLDKNMYMFLCMAIVFYALWSIDIKIKYMIWTVPFISIIAMKYSLDVEGESNGDPIDVIFTDKVLLCLAIIYIFILFFLIYYMP